MKKLLVLLATASILPMSVFAAEGTGPNGMMAGQNQVPQYRIQMVDRESMGNDPMSGDSRMMRGGKNDNKVRPPMMDGSGMTRPPRTEGSGGMMSRPPRGEGSGSMMSRPPRMEGSGGIMPQDREEMMGSGEHMKPPAGGLGSLIEGLSDADRKELNTLIKNFLESKGIVVPAMPEKKPMDDKKPPMMKGSKQMKPTNSGMMMSPNRSSTSDQ